MAISVSCDACGKSYRVKEAVAGKRIKCKECGSAFLVPDSSGDEDIFSDLAREESRAAAAELDEEEPLHPVIQKRPTVKSKKKPAGVGLAGKLLVGVVAAVSAVAGYAASTKFFEMIRSSAALAWQDFSPPDGRFHVDLPGTPKHEAQPAPGLPAEFVVQQFKVELNRGRLMYAVAYLDMSTIPVAFFDTEASLNGSRQGAVNAVQGTLLKESRITLDGHPGLEMEIDVPAGIDPATRKNRMKGKNVSRVYIVNRCLYVLEASGADLTLTSPDVQRYFSSFKLAPGTAPPQPAVPASDAEPNASPQDDSVIQTEIHP